MRLPEGWKEVKLGNQEYFTILSSGIDKFEGEKEYLSTESIQGTKIEKIECVITHEDRPSRANMQPVLNSVWFAKMQATLKIYSFDEENKKEINKYIMSTGFAGIKVNERLVSPKYLRLMLMSKDFNELKDKLSTGSTQRGINNQAIETISLIIPPFKIQQRIVSILEKAEQAKEWRKEADELTTELLKAIFMEMFGAIKLQEFNDEIFKIIDGDRGVNYPHGNDFSNESYCLFLNTGNVRKDGFNFDNLMFITKDKDEQLRKGKVSINDVILTTRGTVGNVALFDQTIKFKHVRINSGMVLLRPNLMIIDPTFLFALIQMPIIQEQFKRANSGTAQPQLPITNLRKIKIPLPPPPLQNKFASIVKEVEAMKEQQKHSKEQLDNLFNVLMQKAFKGELI